MLTPHIQPPSPLLTR